jgi:hypothetical protein
MERRWRVLKQKVQAAKDAETAAALRPGNSTREGAGVRVRMARVRMQQTVLWRSYWRQITQRIVLFGGCCWGSSGRRRRSNRGSDCAVCSCCLTQQEQNDNSTAAADNDGQLTSTAERPWW